MGPKRVNFSLSLEVRLSSLNLLNELSILPNSKLSITRNDYDPFPEMKLIPPPNPQ